MLSNDMAQINFQHTFYINISALINFVVLLQPCSLVFALKYIFTISVNLKQKASKLYAYNFLLKDSAFDTSNAKIVSPYK